MAYDIADVALFDNSTYTEAANLASTNKSVFNVLGDFWVDFYPDIETIDQFGLATVQYLSNAYAKLLNQVLNSSVTTAAEVEKVPLDFIVFNKEWEVDEYNNSTPGIVTVPYIIDCEYLVNSVVSPTVVLKKGTHYTVYQSEATARYPAGYSRFTFYPDKIPSTEASIFNDPGIVAALLSDNLASESESVTDSGLDFIFLWAVDSVSRTYDLYERFGVFLHSPLQKEWDSIQYKNKLRALMILYTQKKSVANIKLAVNAMMGFTYPAFADEVVVAYELNSNLTVAEHVVTTNKAIYRFPYWGIDVQDFTTIGASLTQYELFSYGVEVNDHISTPDWYEGARFPTTLVRSWPDVTPWTDFPESEVFYDDTYYYNGEVTHSSYFDSIMGPTLYMKKAGQPIEQALYGIMHNLLKWNVIQFKAIFPDSMVRDFVHSAGLSLWDLYQLIKPAFPKYMFPCIDEIIELEVRNITTAGPYNGIRIASTVVETQTNSVA